MISTVPDAVYLALALVALTLGVISGIRLVQRAAARRWPSVAAFAVRVALSGVLVWLFVSFMLSA